jgi:hypothetical protein
MSRSGVLLVVLALTFMTVIPVPPAHAAACTRVIGGSQTSNWYSNGGFEALVVNAEWERQSRGGQSIDTWAVDGTGWFTSVLSACTPKVTLPTRLVIHVLPGHTDASVPTVSAQIAAAISAVATKVPSVTNIILIPPVHGVGCDHVTLSRVQPATIEAINQNLSPTVSAGPAVVVPDCAYFSDNAGHLTGTGAAYAAAQYAELLTTPPGPPDTTPPAASILSPSDGALVSGSLSVTMSASDDVAVSRVELKVDGGLVATDNTSPYSVTWNTATVANGTYTLTATAVDTSGNATTSEAVSVTVENSGPPAGQFTASATLVTVGTSVTFTDAYTGNQRRIFNFGDGSSQSSRGPSLAHTYTTAGTYVATLTTTDVVTGERATFQLTVTVTN